MAKSSFFSGTGTNSTDVDSITSSKAAAETAATNAATSETNAASSASSASTSASNAVTSASNASNSATAAATSETNAASSATAASTSQTSATNSATAAATSATNAATSEANAATSETNAASSAAASATSATNAATSLSNIGTAETNAASSATDAATSATNAATSATNASTSETNAATSATTASTAATNASTSETNAATSETNAATSATNAATSETNAATSATSASTSATNAATSASAASASQVSAAASAASAANSYDLFDDRYLGTKTSDPTVDNDGNALVAGALYFNSTANEMRVYDGANWIAASSAGGASLLEYKYTATSGQTTFSGADDNANSLSYTQDNLIVTLNGVVLENGTDYTATTGTSVVLASGAATSDELNVIAFKSFTTADMVAASTGGTFYGDVDVVGTLTSDGLTSSAVITSQESRSNTAGTGQIVIDPDDTTISAAFRIDSTDNKLNIDMNGGGTWKKGFSLYANNDISFYEDTGTTAKFFWDASAESLGIGTSSPSYPLTTLSGTANTAIAQFTGTDVGRGLRIETASTTRSDDTAILNASDAFGELAFETNSTERMRIDSSGNVLVGKTSADFGATAGFEFRGSNDTLYLANDGDKALALNRNSSYGEVLSFRQNDVAQGGIAVTIGPIIGKGACGLGFNTSTSNAIIPQRFDTQAGIDNTLDLGNGSYRFDDIYATNGTIQTSDQNEKQQIASLTDAEITAAKAISKLFKTFKWNDSVAEKGDAARTHSGVIAQDVEQAMTDAGLNAGDYAFFISTTWWETQTDVPAVEADEENGVEAQEAYTRTDTYDTLEEAPEGATERNRKGIRYPQLLSFIGAATEQRLASIETRLDALEAN